jgi:hypothetical protein
MAFEGSAVIRAHRNIEAVQKKFGLKCDKNSSDRIAFLIIRLWFFSKVELFGASIIFLILMALAFMR